MKRLAFLLKLAAVLLFCNIVPLFSILEFNIRIKLMSGVLLAVIYAVLIFIPEDSDFPTFKLRSLNAGCVLTKLAGAALVCELPVLYLYITHCSPGIVNTIFSILLPVILIAVLLWYGVIRIVICCRQIKLMDYILLLVLWWIPFANLFFIVRFYRAARRELVFERYRQELENVRAVSGICHTRYPVLMIHGIFFRDWQYFNYWGRIPAALVSNGANIFYGGQQSAQSVEKSAEELKERILQIVRETGAEKVNIIAHSKGGLDSRYAVSCLGMDKYVASLTTINTPHRGCEMVDYFLEKLPKSVIRFFERRYNGIFTRLGDRSPDFMSGIMDLRASFSHELNERMPDSPLVRYSSYMTFMKSSRSAGFPLNIGYKLTKRLCGENDGLVWTEAARHGDFTLIAPEKKNGISHGDVIDLTGRNIDGFDVREFYVSIVHRLKEEGY